MALIQQRAVLSALARTPPRDVPGFARSPRGPVAAGDGHSIRSGARARSRRATGARSKESPRRMIRPSPSRWRNRSTFFSPCSPCRSPRSRRRAELAEHPFGTLKCRAGYRHFLVRGFDKVRGEWSLMALCYNFSRALNIVGLDRLIGYFAERAPKSSVLLLFDDVAAIIGALMAHLARLARRFAPLSPLHCRRPGFAT